MLPTTFNATTQLVAATTRIKHKCTGLLDKVINIRGSNKKINRLPFTEDCIQCMLNILNLLVGFANSNFSATRSYSLGSIKVTLSKTPIFTFFTKKADCLKEG